MNSNTRRVRAQTHGDAHRSSIHLARVQLELQRSFIARRSHPRRTHCPRTPPCARQLRRAAYDSRSSHEPKMPGPTRLVQQLQTATACRWINSTSSLLIARTTRSSTIARRSTLRAQTRSARPRHVLAHTHSRLALAGAPSSRAHHGLARAQPSVLDARTRSAHTLNKNTTPARTQPRARRTHTHSLAARARTHAHGQLAVQLRPPSRWVYSQQQPRGPGHEADAALGGAIRAKGPETVQGHE